MMYEFVDKRYRKSSLSTKQINHKVTGGGISKELEKNWQVTIFYSYETIYQQKPIRDE